MFTNPLSPTPTDDGAYTPSKLALRLATVDMTDYRKTDFGKPYTGDLKILMICTDQRNMTMANGKQFSTGNHPVEMLVPMMHLTDAGFDIDVVTPTGAPVAIEMWAMPEQDDAVMAFYASFKERFDNPGSVADFAAQHLNDTSPYAAVFLPGGHGAMLGLPENADVGRTIRWCHDRDLHLLAICHGPAALLAANLPDPADPSASTTTGGTFPYRGYQITAFPDRIDRQTPRIGYMPGPMPWHFGEKLQALGIDIRNTKADDSCYTDRKLVSGASPKAANRFGQMAARALLDEFGRAE
jgi:molecular chaperone Hsp31 and glyoxalase 3